MKIDRVTPKTVRYNVDPGSGNPNMGVDYTAPAPGGVPCIEVTYGIHFRDGLEGQLAQLAQIRTPRGPAVLTFAQVKALAALVAQIEDETTQPGPVGR